MFNDDEEEFKITFDDEQDENTEKQENDAEESEEIEETEDTKESEKSEEAEEDSSTVAQVKTTKEAEEKAIEKAKMRANNSFDSEELILSKFVNWQTDEYAQKTLMKMGYNLNDIKSVTAYIAEDDNGKRKVKLKVKLKPITTGSASSGSMLNQLKAKLETNESIKQLIDKVKNSDIVLKLKGTGGKK